MGGRDIIRMGGEIESGWEERYNQDGGERYNQDGWRDIIRMG